MSNYGLSEKGKKFCKESVGLICFGTIIFIIIMICAIVAILGFGKSIAFVVLCAIGIILSIVYCVVGIKKLKEYNDEPKAYVIIGLLSIFSALVPFIFMMIFAVALKAEENKPENSTSNYSSSDYGYGSSGYSGYSGYSNNWYVKEGDTSGKKYRLDGCVMRTAQDYDACGGHDTYGDDVVYVEGQRFIKIKDPEEEIFDRLTKEHRQYKAEHPGESSKYDNPAYTRLVAKYMNELENGKASFVNPFLGAMLSAENDEKNGSDEEDKD